VWLLHGSSGRALIHIKTVSSLHDLRRGGGASAVSGIRDGLASIAHEGSARVDVGLKYPIQGAARTDMVTEVRQFIEQRTQKQVLVHE
jgi:hypothetical protein